MLRRTARKRKAKGQEISLPRNVTTRAEILATGHQTQTSMTRTPTFSTAMSTSGPIPYATNVGSVTSLHLGATDATTSQQSSTSADTHTVSSPTHLTDNNVPMQNADVNAATVSISGNITDFRNTNGKEIECSFTGIISSIAFLAKDKSSGTFKSIAYSKENKNLTLTEFGNNIFDNVTTSFKPGSKSIIFNGLSCLHVREYQCQIWISQIGGGYKSIESMVMHITVKVWPSKPEMSFTTLDQQENSTKPSTNNTKFKWSLPLMSNKRAFNEGDNITFKCDGDVGRPKGNFIWQKIYPNKPRYNYTSIPTETTPENCTFSGTSNLTIQVTAEDNLSKIRCIVKSHVSEVEMSADSEPLLIYFQVREPYISVEPNETVYKEGELIQLNCKGYGNPYPSFSWTKHSKGNISDETISDNDTLVIQNVTISDNGLFTCNTSNEINGEIYSASRSTDIIIDHEVELSTNSGNHEVEPSTNTGNVFNVGIVCGSIIVVIVAILLFVIHRTRNKCCLSGCQNERPVGNNNSTPQGHSPLYEGVEHAFDIHNYEQMSRKEHLYSNTNI